MLSPPESKSQVYGEQRNGHAGGWQGTSANGRASRQPLAPPGGGGTLHGCGATIQGGWQGTGNDGRSAMRSLAPPGGASQIMLG